MEEIEVWRNTHTYNEFADFYLKRGNGIINVFYSLDNGWIMISSPCTHGYKSDPFSFLVITGCSVEEAWKRSGEIKLSEGVITLREHDQTT